MLDIKLDTLLTVYEKKNFTRAAEELSLTQPAVSHHITLLEKELGVRIFNRNHGELRLTAEGEIVVQYAKRLRAIYDKMCSHLSDAEHRLARIQVGITHTAESNLIAEVLAKYSNRNTGMIITITTDTVPHLYEMLENYDLDLAIVEGPVTDNGLSSLMLDTDYLVCVMANDNPLACKSHVTLGDLKKEKLILRLPNSGTRNLFASSLESINESLDQFNIILEVDNIATIKDLIRKGMGVSILARSACMDELRKGKITALPVENLPMLRQTHILYHEDFAHPDVLREIVKLYQETEKLYG